MELVTVILFLVLYYLRPQEWSSVFATVHFVQSVMLAGLAMLFLRGEGLRPRDLFRTPHDWAVFGFWLWIGLSAVHPWTTLRENINVYIFYVVTLQVLSTVPRLLAFLCSWTLLIVVVALLALATKWGFDPLDSLPITNGPMKGRLILNLSIFNNPNGLGHSVVPAIPMLYYFFIWKRPITSRFLGLGLMLIPLECIYQTVSKGSFICGAVTMVATMAFGRPKKVQIMIAVVALTFGPTALFLLPRLTELSHTKTDPAIQGRVQAFKYGYGKLQANFWGIGKGEWGRELFITDYFKVPVPPKNGVVGDKGHYRLKAYKHSKAPHSSYVSIGTELGVPGLFLLAAVLYCNLRSTITAQTSTDDEERIRRMLFVLVLSYIVSSWMVDFEYRPTFFLFTAAIAALHRHLLGMNNKDEAETELALEPLPVWNPPPLMPQPSFAAPWVSAQIADHLGGSVAMEAHTLALEPTRPGIWRRWNRLTLLDYLMIAAGTWAIMRVWVYMITHV